MSQSFLSMYMHVSITIETRIHHSHMERLRAVKFGGKLDLRDRNKWSNFWTTKLFINKLFMYLIIYTWSKLSMSPLLILYLPIWPQLLPMLLLMLLPSAQSKLYLFPPIQLLVRSFWLIYERKKWTPNYPELYILTKLPNVIILAYMLKLY